MKKAFRNGISVFAAAAVACIATACSIPTPPREYDPATRVATDTGEEVFTPDSADFEFYNNYIELYDDAGTAYNLGDPYVMRFDGKYYLYASIDNSTYRNAGANAGKIPVWISDNLVDWQWGGFAYDPATDGISPTGASYIAFAPEVVYYKGYFYLCESQRGNGHYFFRSSSPTGPFTLISDNLGKGIDGTFYLHDDGQLYFISANNGDAAANSHITACTIDFPESADGSVSAVLGEITVIEEAYLDGWTEGPGFFRRDGYSYMTYTGNHVDSASYRVGYAYSEGNFPLSDLQTKTNNTTLITSGMDEEIQTPYNGKTAFAENFRGAGHSSNVTGPDLDGVWTAYHIANRLNYNNNFGDGQRRYAVTQYFTNGSYVLTNGLGNYQKTKPASPDYFAAPAALVSRDGFSLSDKSTEKVYTAELSFALTAGKGEAVAGFVSPSDYASVSVSGGTLTYKLVSGGKSVTVATAAVSESTNAEAVHTVKIVNGAKKVEIYYDNMLAVSSQKTTGAGAVGYGAGAKPSSTVFTNEAFGTSDFDAVKDLTGSWAAYSYLKGENRGWQIAAAKVNSDGVRQGEAESTKAVSSLSARALVLKEDDWVKYLVNAPEAGTYSLNLLAGAASAGCVFEVIIDNQTITKMEISSDFGGNDYVNLQAGAFEIGAGLHTLKIRVFSGTLDAVNFSTERNAQSLGRVTDKLDSREGGAFTCRLGSNYSVMGGVGTVTSTSDKRTLFVAGSTGRSDYEFSVDVKIIQNSLGGILFRVSDYSYSDYRTTSVGTRFTGYFLSLNTSYVALWRYDQGKQEQLKIMKPHSGVTFAGQNVVTVTVKAKGGTITVSLNGEEAISVFDPEAFLSGFIGLYTEADTSFAFTNYTYCEL